MLTKDFNSLLELFEVFSTEQKCIDHLENYVGMEMWLVHLIALQKFINAKIINIVVKTQGNTLMLKQIRSLTILKYH